MTTEIVLRPRLLPSRGIAATSEANHGIAWIAHSFILHGPSYIQTVSSSKVDNLCFECFNLNLFRCHVSVLKLFRLPHVSSGSRSFPPLEMCEARVLRPIPHGYLQRLAGPVLA